MWTLFLSPWEKSQAVTVSTHQYKITCNLCNRRQIQSILSYHFFSCKDLQDIFKIELLVYHYSARKLNQDEYLESESTELTFLVLNLLMAIWFHQTAVMFIALLDNSGMKGPHRAFDWACCSKNGQLLGHSRELRNLFSQFLKISREGDCTISVGKLLSCLIGHMGKGFSFYSIENPLYSILLLSCPLQVSWTLYLQSSSHGIPSTISWMNQSLVSYSPGSVPSYSPSPLPSGASSPLAHGH